MRDHHCHLAMMTRLLPNSEIDWHPVIDQVKRAVPVRQALRLVGWKVRGKRAACGLREHSQKLTVAFNDRFWNCHACNIGGDVIRLIELADKRDFASALKLLAEEARIPLATKMTREEHKRYACEQARRQRHQQKLDAACDDFAELERSMRRECRDLLHFCDDLLTLPGEWSEAQWRLASIAAEVRRDLLCEYAILSFGAMEQRMEYILASELRRVGMLASVRRAGGVIADDGHFVEVTTS
jgi:hypothetical protein